MGVINNDGVLSYFGLSNKIGHTHTHTKICVIFLFVYFDKQKPNHPKGHWEFTHTTKNFWEVEKEKVEPPLCVIQQLSVIRDPRRPRGSKKSSLSDTHTLILGEGLKNVWSIRPLQQRTWKRKSFIIFFFEKTPAPRQPRGKEEKWEMCWDF